MKNNQLVITLITLFILGFGLNTQTTPTRETAAQKERRVEWSSQARLRIFIHWGIYAVNGVSESWSFFDNYLPCEEYVAQEKGFTASVYNSQEWVKLIRENGAHYAIITTKRYGGVALWDTKVGDSSTVESAPAGCDLVTPFVKEVRKQGLELGFYYSLLDWSHPDYPNKTRTEVRYKNDPDRWAKFVSFNFGQLSELGKTWKPDSHWPDGDREQTAEAQDSKEIINLLRSTNPNIIVNSRIQGYGNYVIPERGIPVARLAGKYWEPCMTVNDSWGHQHAGTNYKTPFMLLRIFVDYLNTGGNLLLNIGPKEDGTIPAEQTAVLKEFGRQMKRHKGVIYETRVGIPCERFQGYTTLNKIGDIFYLYLSYKPNSLIEVKGLVNKVNRVQVVGNGAMLPYKVYNRNYWGEVPGNLYIDIPEHVQDKQITVIAMLPDGLIKFYHGMGRMVESN